MKLIVQIPCLNEERTLPQTIADIPREIEGIDTIEVKRTMGGWYRGWRLVSLDGSTMAVADSASNQAPFGRPGRSRGRAAQPLLRFVSLAENGTHVLFGARMADYHSSETTLARGVVPHLRRRLLCLADRSFFGFELWQQAQAGGAQWCGG